MFTANCLERRSVSSEYIHEHSCSSSDNDAHGTRLGSCIDSGRPNEDGLESKAGSRKLIGLIRTTESDLSLMYNSTPNGETEPKKFALDRVNFCISSNGVIHVSSTRQQMARTIFDPLSWPLSTREPRFTGHRHRWCRARLSRCATALSLSFPFHHG